VVELIIKEKGGKKREKKGKRRRKERKKERENVGSAIFDSSDTSLYS
jgi:hypothetical protein